MTQEEAWAKEQRKIDAETSGPFVIPPFMKKAEEKEDIEETQDDERPDSGKSGQASGEENSTHTQDSRMSQLPPTANAASTARIPEDEALALMEAHGVQTQVIDDRIQALSVWTDKHAGGGIGSEWVNVVCRRDWIRAFLGY